MKSNREPVKKDAHAEKRKTKRERKEGTMESIVLM